MNRSDWLIAVMLLTMCFGGFSQAAKIDVDRLQRADTLIEAAIERGDIPGAVLIVGLGDEVVYRKAFGSRAIEPAKQPMAIDTVFDLASLTKVVATATSVMVLAERGEIVLTDPVNRYLPEFGNNGKESITVEDLLLHRGGLVPDNPMSDYADGPAVAMEKIHTSTPKWEPRERFAYTDVGFIVLAELVKKVDGRSVDQFAREEIFLPLQMKDTMYKPTDDLKARCITTVETKGKWLIGEVHDPRADALGGVAGHAGLFSTADDLARYCRMILNNGSLAGKRILGEATVRAMTQPREIGKDVRGYGWDIDTRYSSPRGDLFEPLKTFGHTGYTGTSLWLDPTHDCYVVLLTNRVHPKDGGAVTPLRRRLANVVASSIVDTLTASQSVQSLQSADVMLGVDVLQKQGFTPIKGKRIALITNHTGTDRDGNRTLDIIFNASDVKLVKLFSPEHGLYGKLDEKVGHTVESTTGLRVFSLYGKTQKPSAEMLEGVDTIVFDIQDIGTRFYTYISTMGKAMEAAAENDLEFVVLDRPNPINGVRVDGPLADADKFSFAAYGPIPTVHGMTVGELAEMFNTEYEINCKLQVVKVEGWQRAMWWDQTNLMWTNPSPNMRNLTQATLYPAIGLLEAANLSVGRGTDQPFEFLGAPWIDGRKLAKTLNDANLPGIRFVPIAFTPDASKFKDELCQGVYIFLTDREAFQPIRTGLTIAYHLRDLFGDAFDVKGVMRLLVNDVAYDALLQVSSPAKLPAVWQEDLRTFKQTREKYLLYR